MSAERARLFVALELPRAVRSVLFAWARQRVGETPRVRVVDAESLLTQARGQMQTSLYDYLIARAALQRSTGGGGAAH